jgi:FlaA1/EpsC-like NDP-sugar epimerase
MTKDKRQSDPLKGLERFWIIGAGRFGRIAVDRIRRKKADAAITVVDKKSTDLGQNGVIAVQQDGIHWLAATLQPKAPVDIVVPAIPVHVAYEWLKSNLLEKYKIHPIYIPDEWLSRMPHAMRGAVGKAYVSHADFICPDNCPAPKTICTHTGKPRPMDLFRLLAGLDFNHS